MDQYQQSEKRVRNARHAYYAMVSYVDDKVGQLLKALRDADLSDNTIVIFTSDHGDMLGERGLWYKMSFFEGSARVPLMVCAPNHFSTHRINRHVSLVDLLPTLVELAADDQSHPYSDDLDGRSLVPLLRGDTMDGDNTILGEVLCEGAQSPVVMIRRDQYKYIYCDTDPDQLYDLSNDPQELQNLAGQKQHKDLRCAFEEEVTARWNLKALNQTVLDSQRHRRLVTDALKTGRHTAWDFQPYQDASKMYMRNHLRLDDLERRARFPVPPLPDPNGRG